MSEINLMHGDCLEKMQSIKSGSIDLILTDPPYGTTQCKWDSVIPLDEMWLQLNRVIKPNGAIVMTAAQPFTTVLIGSNLPLFRYCWVWDKIKGTGFLNAKKMPMRNHEDVVIFYNKLPTYNPQMTNGHQRKVSHRKATLQTDVYNDMKNDYHYDSTERFPTSIQTISTDTQSSSLHPTQKPVALMEYLIKTYTNRGETVLDFTMGSGTTGVACVKSNRNFIGIEKDEAYFNIAQNRIDETIATPDLFQVADAKAINEPTQQSLLIE